MGKFLGQHFLANQNKLRQIVEALDLEQGDTIIEIGPGHGELTLEIKNSAYAKASADRQKSKIKNVKIIAIEKDKRLAQLLEKKLVQDNDIKIILGDALKVLPELIHNLQLTTNNYKIVGNIPYYITGHLLRTVGELKNKPSLIVFTVQKEVAERICSQPPKMNLLAASVQFWAGPEITGYISKKDFKPQPKVNSAILKISPRIYAERNADLRGKYYKLVKALFRQPRKTVYNNLRQATNDLQLIKQSLKSAGIVPNARPQDLSFERIIKLSARF